MQLSNSTNSDTSLITIQLPNYKEKRDQYDNCLNVIESPYMASVKQSIFTFTFVFPERFGGSNFSDVSSYSLYRQRTDHLKVIMSNVTLFFVDFTSFIHTICSFQVLRIAPTIRITYNLYGCSSIPKIGYLTSVKQ